METKNGTWFKNHSHTWIVIILGSALAILFINWLPDQKIFSSTAIGMVVSHAIIVLIALYGGWMILPQRFVQNSGVNNKAAGYDFGWSLRFTKGFGYASILLAIVAFYSWFTLPAYPVAQLVIFVVLLLLSVNFFIANILARGSQSPDNLVLPYVELVKGGAGTILDAGCGSGRTTISMGKATSEIKIVGFDRFDAGYIDDGGKALFNRNIAIAGLAPRVSIVQGDILGMPFSDGQFDAVMSSYMFDHLGDNRLPALQETWRVLKPGGRFLLIVMVRGYSTFAMANILSLSFSTRAGWRKLFTRSNFRLVDEGNLNFGAYFLIEKPLT